MDLVGLGFVRPYGANASLGLLTQDGASLVLGYYPFLPTGGASREFRYNPEERLSSYVHRALEIS